MELTFDGNMVGFSFIQAYGCNERIMIMKNLKDRLHYCFDEEFKRLLNLYLKCDEFDYNRNMRAHFQLIRENDPAYLNHTPVLSLSFGGSTTKLMLASTVE